MIPDLSTAYSAKAEQNSKNMPLFARIGPNVKHNKYPGGSVYSVDPSVGKRRKK